MNPYDQAHHLARAIKESDYYKDMVKAKQAIDGDEESKKILADLRERQFELERYVILGQDQPKEKVESFKQIQVIAQANQRLNSYLETEYKFARMMADIQKIIADALNLSDN